MHCSYSQPTALILKKLRSKVLLSGFGSDQPLTGPAGSRAENATSISSCATRARPVRVNRSKRRRAAADTHGTLKVARRKEVSIVATVELVSNDVFQSHAPGCSGGVSEGRGEERRVLITRHFPSHQGRGIRCGPPDRTHTNSSVCGRMSLAADHPQGQTGFALHRDGAVRAIRTTEASITSLVAVWPQSSPEALESCSSSGTIWTSAVLENRARVTCRPAATPPCHTAGRCAREGIYSDR